jgi:hypothetical protein
MKRLRVTLEARRHDEAGVTLVELIVAIVILTMITGAIAAAFITAIDGVQPTNERVQESTDAQTIQAFLVRDAQSAGGTIPASGTGDPTLGVSSPGTAPDCAGPTGTVVVRFAWTDLAAPGSPKHVANYFFDASQHSLVRQTCVNGIVDATIQLGASVFAVDTGATTSATSNKASCIAADGTETDCPTSPAASLPDRMRLRITETNQPINEPSQYVYTLWASLRPVTPTASQQPGGPGNSTPVPLVTLGGCNSTSSINLQGSPDVVVYGGVVDNNTCASPAVSQQPGSHFDTTGGVTTPTTPLQDPYASLAPPTADCTNGTHGGTSGPGTYTAAASFNNVTFATGIYIFCNGVTLTGTIDATAGVLFYVVGGTLNGSNANIQMAPMSNGLYGNEPGGAALVVWQTATDTAQMTLCCSNTASATISGTIYAPTATVQLKNADMTIRQIVAYAVLFGPGGGTHSTVIGNKPTAPVSLTTTSLPAWTVNRPYPGNVSLSATGGTPPYVYTVTGLPAGFKYDPVSGAIVGTATVANTYNVTATVTDSIGEQDIKTMPLLINAPPTISAPASLPNWTIGRNNFATTITASGGTPDPVTGYAWAATGLPPGLSINTNGSITGTPTQVGSFNNVVVTVTDATGASGSRNYSITINDVPKITGPASMPNWTVGQAYPAQTMTNTNGTSPFSWTASGLPTGLSIASGTGVISGTPTAAGNFSITVTLHDTTGASDVKVYSVTINPAPGIQTGSLPNGEQNRPYDFTLTPTAGGTPPFTWSSSPLPTGLNLNAATGEITGTPTVTFNGNITFTITDSTNASTSKTLALVIAAPVSITAPASLAPWTINRNYPATQMTAANGETPYAWSATGLPAGMNINGAGNGVISGTPTVSGTFTVTVTVTDALGGTNAKVFTLVINQPPTVSTGSIPNGEQNVSYSATVAATLGTPGYTWTASGLPNGVTINALTGVISGTPTQAGPFTITVTATDTAGAVASATYNITVALPISITGPGSLPSGTVNVVYPGATITDSGGATPLTWSATGLPPGLTIDSTGTIGGTPTAAGSYTPTVKVTDAFGAVATHGYTITISATPVITTAGLPDWTVNTPYSFTMAAVGGTAPLTWSASGLPSGLGINPATGVISGTPTAVGSYTATINVQDSLGASAVPASFTFAINQPPQITTSSLPDGVQNVAGYSTSLAGALGTPTYTWSATGLPNGLTISTGGVISGTPTVTFNGTVNVKLTDAAGAQVSVSLPLRVFAKMVISSPASLQPWTVNRAYPSATVTATGGTGTYTWAATGLPAGMTINSATGVISGTPTATLASGTVQITATDNANPPQSVVKNYTLTINPGPAITTLSCIAQKNQSFSIQLTNTGGTAPFAWTATGLPAFASLSASGLLTGNAPNVVTTYTFTVQVTDTSGAFDSETFTLTAQSGNNGTTC